MDDIAKLTEATMKSKVNNQADKSDPDGRHNRVTIIKLKLMLPEQICQHSLAIYVQIFFVIKISTSCNTSCIEKCHMNCFSKGKKPNS